MYCLDSCCGTKWAPRCILVSMNCIMNCTILVVFARDCFECFNSFIELNISALVGNFCKY